MTRPRFGGVTFWMSISGISSMSKSLCDYEGIGCTLSEPNDPMGGITGVISSITRPYSPMFTDDEVKHRPAIWQQMVCTP